jgi:hypothetical protein
LATQRLQSQLWFAVAALLLIGLSIEIAHRTTEQAAHYGASGMVAGMAAMMNGGGMMGGWGLLAVVILVAGAGLIASGLAHRS